ncbi:hypothetical protein [Salinisphaera sp. PC39]|uniref:hypothetical protein n=1 Tax=Salinisphaera sp. PC39 TaxID=1304156 RepID=UPI00333FDE4C
MMTDKVTLFVTIFILLAPCMSCSLSMKDMRIRFQEAYIDAAKGRHLNDLKKDEFSVIGNRKVTRIERLNNGNELHIYEGFWLQYDIEREPCDVFFEVDPITNRVVEADSEGEGCYMPY